MSVVGKVIGYEMSSKPRGFRAQSFIFDKLDELYGKDFVKATEEQDRHEGTDCFIQRLRVDVTLHAAKKDRMIYCGNVDSYAFHINVFIRFGNRHVDFPEPVMVLEFLVGANRHGNYLVQSYLDKEIVSECMDLFFSKLDEIEDQE
jgi:hypothetical protein